MSFTIFGRLASHPDNRREFDLPIRIPGLDKGQNADGIRLFLDKDGAGNTA